jgi:hypothetical protein
MTVTINLNPELEARLQAEADRLGTTAEKVLEEIADRSLPPFESSTEHPILGLARKFISSIPADKLADVPADLAINHDHYLYGAPKRNYALTLRNRTGSTP